MKKRGRVLPLLKASRGTGPPLLENVCSRGEVKRRGGMNFSLAQGPLGGSQGHSAKFSSAGT